MLGLLNAAVEKPPYYLQDQRVSPESLVGWFLFTDNLDYVNPNV